MPTSEFHFLGVAPLCLASRAAERRDYDSLQATVNKRLSHGFQFLAAYTLSQSVDSAQGQSRVRCFRRLRCHGVRRASIQRSEQRSRAARAFRLRSQTPVRAQLNLATPAAGEPSARFVGTLAAGWAVSGVVTLQSGLPFSIFDSGAGTLFGPATYFTTGSLAPGKTLEDAVRTGSVRSRINQFFNTAYLLPAPFIPDGGLIDGKFPVSGGGTIFGNLGRNMLRGPGQRNVDMVLHQAHKTRSEGQPGVPLGGLQRFQLDEFCQSRERCLESEHVRKDQRDERESSHHAIRVEAGVLIPWLEWNDV